VGVRPPEQTTTLKPFEGILFLTLPKSEEVKPRKITVSD